MRFRSLAEFTGELDRAATDILVARGLTRCEEYRLRVEECPVHGPGCARVTYGALRDHVSWRWSDPAESAAAMLGTMFPKGTAGAPAAE